MTKKEICKIVHKIDDVILNLICYIFQIFTILALVVFHIIFIMICNSIISGLIYNTIDIFEKCFGILIIIMGTLLILKLDLEILKEYYCSK